MLIVLWTFSSQPEQLQNYHDLPLGIRHVHPLEDHDEQRADAVGEGHQNVSLNTPDLRPKRPRHDSTETSSKKAFLPYPAILRILLQKFLVFLHFVS